jgi:hypothetical protein
MRKRFDGGVKSRPPDSIHQVQRGVSAGCSENVGDCHPEAYSPRNLVHKIEARFLAEYRSE